MKGKIERDGEDAEARARREMRAARRLSLPPVLTSHRQWPFPKKMEFIENGRLKNIWSQREAEGLANTTVAQ